jgi:hypothetical protein
MIVDGLRLERGQTVPLVSGALLQIGAPPPHGPVAPFFFLAAQSAAGADGAMPAQTLPAGFEANEILLAWLLEFARTL